MFTLENETLIMNLDDDYPDNALMHCKKKNPGESNLEFIDNNRRSYLLVTADDDLSGHFSIV